MANGIPSISSNVNIDEEIIDSVIENADKVTADENSSLADQSRTAIFKGAVDSTTDIKEITDLYNVVSGLSNLEDYQQLGAIRQYVSDSLPAPDYKKFIKEPSGALPLYALGASLKNSELRGDTNKAKLVRATTAYLAGKNQEDAAFDATKKRFEFERAQKIDQIAKELFVDSMKNKNELAKKLVDNKYFGTRDLYYQIGGDGKFDYSNPLFLSQVEANKYVNTNGVSSLRKASGDEEKLKNVRIETVNPTDNTVTVEELMLPNYKIIEMERNPNITITDPRGDTNGNTYIIEDNDGKKSKRFLNVDQYNNVQTQVDSGNLKSVTAIPAGTAKYIDALDNGLVKTLTHEQALMDPERYFPYTTSLTAKVDPKTGEIEITQSATGGGSNAMYKEGIKNEQETFNQASNITNNVLNFHTANTEVRNIISDYQKAGMNPNELFSDATVIASLGTRLIKDFETFTSILTTPQGNDVSGTNFKGAGTTFIIADTISNDMNETEIRRNEVGFDEFKSTILNNSEYIAAREQFMQGDLATKLLAANVSRETIEAAFFDLALQSASTYSKGDGLDLRAMSDKDVIFNIRNVGGQASTLEGFLAVNNRFTRGLINSNIRKLKTLEENYPLLDSLVKPDGVSIDIERQDKLKKHIKSQIEELEDISPLYAGTPLDIVYGVAGREYQADDVTKIDMSDVFLSPELLQDSNRARVLNQNFGITNLTQNYDVNTTLSNGQTISQLIMQYQTFLNNGDTERLDIFSKNLQKRISAEELATFNFFNRIFAQKKQERINELTGDTD